MPIRLSSRPKANGHLSALSRSLSKSQPVMINSDRLDETAEDVHGTGQLQINLDELVPLEPPDGGYAWVILVASFLCMALVDGTCASYGMLLDDLQDTFSASKSTVSLGGSLITGCYLVFGPLASGLSNQYSHRSLVMVGSVISAFSISLSTFIPHVYGFMLVFGLLGGLGFSLIYLPASTILSMWFYKRRATAIGISACGSGIGSMIYALMVPRLLVTYNWQGCLLILGGITLNCMVAGALLIPLDKYQTVLTEKRYKTLILSPDELKNLSIGREIPIEPRGRSNSAVEGVSAISPLLTGDNIHDSTVIMVNDTNLDMTANTYGSIGNSIQDLHQSGPGKMFASKEFEEIRRLAQQQVETERAARKLSTDRNRENHIHTSQVMISAENDTGDRLQIASQNLTSQLQVATINRLVEEAVNEQVSVVHSFGSNLHRSALSLSTTKSRHGSRLHLPTEGMILHHDTGCVSRSIAHSTISLRGTDIDDMDALKDVVLKKLRSEVSKPSYKQDYLYSGSMMHLNKFVSVSNMDMNMNVNEYLKRVQDPERPGESSSWPVFQMMKKMLDFEIFSSITFLLIVASSILTMFGYLVPIMFLPNLADHFILGPSAGPELLLYMSLSNTIARAGAGALSDLPFVDPLWLNNFSLVFGGTVLSLVPLFSNYAGLMTAAVFYGALIAVFVSIRVVVVVQLLGLNRLTNAFGILLLFQGLSASVSIPLLGKFYDAYKSYDYTFIFAGAAIILSGVLCFPLNWLARWENNRNNRQKEEI